MPKIRHEINILNGTMGAGGISGEMVAIDPSKYSGSVSFYFETVVTASSTGQVVFQKTSSGASFGFTSYTSSTPSVQRISITPNAGADTYQIQSQMTVGTLKAARLIVIQDTGVDSLRQCETQIEIGSRSSVTAATIPTGTVATNQQNPKYWFYDSAKWDGSPQFFFEATFITPTSKSTASVQLQVADGTGDGFAGWANVTNGLVNTTFGAGGSGVPIRAASPFTPISGRWYRIMSLTPTSKSAMNVYGAKIIVRQGFLATTFISQAVNNSGTQLYGYAGGNSTDTVAQSFTVGAVDINLTAITVSTSPNSSPTDSLYIDLTTTLGGAPFATSALNPTAGPNQRFVFAPVRLTANAVYYLNLRRTVADTVSNYSVGMSSSSSYAGGTCWTNAASFPWSAFGAAYDVTFSIIGYNISEQVTKLQPQYLLLNTLVATGTALQGQLINWDSSEWSGLTNNYKLEVNAANGSLSAMQLKTADDVTLVATVTSPDNAGSGVATMP
jgi:hypothetical protein